MDETTRVVIPARVAIAQSMEISRNHHGEPIVAWLNADLSGEPICVEMTWGQARSFAQHVMNAEISQ